MRLVRVLTRLNIGGPALHAAILSSQLDPQRFSTCLVVGQPDTDEGDLSDLVRGPAAVSVHALLKYVHHSLLLVSGIFATATGLVRGMYLLTAVGVQDHVLHPRGGPVQFTTVGCCCSALPGS